MKNVLVYVNPNKKFDLETEILVKIQIDNSIDLGWTSEDMILLTNFDYEYNGVKAKIIADNNYCYFRPLSTKTVAVVSMFEANMILEGETYWVHDFDAFQLIPFEESKLKLKHKDLALTTYGWSSKWCLGSYFFKYEARDMFELLKGVIYQYKIEDERALMGLTYGKVDGINDRITVLNISYQVGQRHIKENYELAKKPLKIVHFHPNRRHVLNGFMYGYNEIKKPLMNLRLIKIFNQHGIK